MACPCLPRSHPSSSPNLLPTSFPSKRSILSGSGGRTTGSSCSSATWPRLPPSMSTLCPSCFAAGGLPTWTRQSIPPDSCWSPIGRLISLSSRLPPGSGINPPQGGQCPSPSSSSPPYSRPSRRIWLLNMRSLPLKGAVQTEGKRKTDVLRKFADSHVVILSPEKAPTLQEIISAGPAPDVILVTGKSLVLLPIGPGSLQFELYSALFLRGTAAIIQMDNPTVVAIQIFIEQVYWLLGRSSHISASYGGSNIRLCFPLQT